MNDYKKLTLAYRNENDRAFGLAGMVFTLGNLDALDSVQGVTIDTDGPMVTFTHPYYHCMAPTASARAVWDVMKRNFYITASMVVGNVMARAMVLDGTQVPDSLLDEIFDQVKAEGEDTLMLDDDEIESLYGQILQQSRRLFGNPRLHSPLRQLSGILAGKRTLTGLELIDELQEL